MQNLALILTHLDYPLAHRVCEFLDHSGSKANAHKLVMTILLGLYISRTTIAFCFKCNTHFFEPFLDHIQFLERFFMQILDLRTAHTPSRSLFAIFAF